jgi:transglutaminase-like putative cysteine protease
MQHYLHPSKYIDCEHRGIVSRAARLAGGAPSERAVAQRCFEFVRDEIRHSSDFKLNPVTCKASDVLQYRTGYCYAKSHLLAALLRANGIPAGLCYQRLSLGEGGAPYCLHGLNAMYLRDFGWCRIDARGNKPGVETKFSPPVEALAFPTPEPFEHHLSGVLAEPLQVVVEVLERCATYDEVLANLPDIELAAQPLVQATRARVHRVH